MDNETYVLGLYNKETWSFYNGENWTFEVKEATKMDRDSAFDLCEQFAGANLQVCIFKSSIFDIKNCPQIFSFEGE